MNQVTGMLKKLQPIGVNILFFFFTNYAQTVDLVAFFSL